jgi:hypothetical protein
MNIFVFGSNSQNEHVALKIARELNDGLSHNFIESCDPIDFIYESEIFIMDAVQKINKVTMFNNIKNYEDSQIGSLHEKDLRYFLKISNKLDLNHNVTILGLPMKGNYNKIKKDVTESLQALPGYVYQ